MTHSTENAQRRLLEALGELAKTDGGLPGLLWAMPLAVDMADQTDQPALANVWRRFSDLVEATERDLKGTRR